MSSLPGSPKTESPKAHITNAATSSNSSKPPAFIGIPQISVLAFLEVLSQPHRGRTIRQQHPELHKNVRSILHHVRQGGHSALKALQAQYDPQVQHLDTYPTQPLIEPLCPSLQAALDHAYRNLLHVHQAQYPNDLHTEPQPGLSISQHFRPIQRVGLYVPGGSAPLVSTLLMLGVPAKVAGCQQRVLCSPAIPSSAMQYAAALCGIEHIYAYGGAQAIAAMAYGTEGVPKVDKLFGPGNAYVTEAKRQVSQDPFGAAMDLPAGPSELMVVADQQANPDWVAADLLSQGEHGTDSQLVLISFDHSQLDRIERALKQQLEALPRRSLAEQSLANSYQLVVTSKAEALKLINAYAPEHLILNVAQPESYLQGIMHAGTVFLGRWTPEALGDYASGSNHVLPTYGFAKYHSGLGTGDFMKSVSMQQATPAALQSMAATLTHLARFEQLEGHARAIDQRVSDQGVTDKRVIEHNDTRIIPQMTFINPKWQNFTGYQSAPDQSDLVNNAITDSDVNHSPTDGKPIPHTGLNANELPKPWVQLPNAPDAPPINRYPRSATHIQQQYAHYAGVTPEQCLVCRGADEGIELLIRACCRPQEAIMTLTPSYGMYAISAELQGIGCLSLPLYLAASGVSSPKDLTPDSARTSLDLDSLDFDSWELHPWALDSPSLVSQSRDRASLTTQYSLNSVRLFFLCNPNNPTGQVVNLATITRLLELLGPNRLLVVDEAYIEFAEIASAVQLLDQYPNLAILRTLSKAFGLAGLRLGFVLAQASVIALLRRMQAPYPICSLVEPWVNAAFTPAAANARNQAINDIKQRRQQFLLDCQGLAGVQAHPSQGNFVLLTAHSADPTPMSQTPNPVSKTVQDDDPRLPASLWLRQGSLLTRIMDACTTHKLAVRAFNVPINDLMRQALRISIGTQADMQRLMRILTQVCEKTPSHNDHPTQQPTLEPNL